jgi:hypothetical protein
MSDFIKGDLIILYVWDDISAYLPIACLTSNSLSQTRNIIEAQTKCEPGQVVKGSGSLNNEITFEGNYIDTTSAGAEVTKASHDKIMLLINAGSIVTWKMDTGLTDTVAYYGEGLFSDLEMTAPAGDEFVTFSGTLSVSGAIVTVDPNTP